MFLCLLCQELSELGSTNYLQGAFFFFYFNYLKRLEGCGKCSIFRLKEKLFPLINRISKALSVCGEPLCCCMCKTFHTEATGVRVNLLPGGSILSGLQQAWQWTPLSGEFSHEIPSPFREVRSGGYTEIKDSWRCLQNQENVMDTCVKFEVGLTDW